MPFVVPHALEDAVYAATPPISPGELARAIVDRSKRYTSDRDRLGAVPPGDLAARALFFTICDAMKIAIPLHELARQGALPRGRPLRVVDLGAGCGAMTLGMIATLRELADRTSALAEGIAPLVVTAIDRDTAALGIARKAIGQLARVMDVPVQLTDRNEDVARAAIPPCDLVVAGTVMNELSPEARIAVIERALAAIGDDGAVIVVEPALRDTARALHELRDHVVASQRGHVFAPCTRRGTPCTALVDPDDWCHEDRPLELPPRTAELARRTHLRDSGMKLSYLVLRKQPAPLVDDLEAWRLVSAPMPAKGKLEVIGCGERGRVTLRLLKRHRSSTNRSFERADRGDVVSISSPAGPPVAVADGRVEIVDDTAIARTTVPARADEPR